MKLVSLFLVTICLLACQSVPKQAPTAQQLDEALPGLAKAGYKSFKCKVQAQSLDQADSDLEQFVAKKYFGRSMNAAEIKALKEYNWALVVDENESKIEGKSSAELHDSENARNQVQDVKNWLLIAADPLALFYVDPTIDLKETKPELVSGGYVYQPKRSKVFFPADFENAQLETVSSSGKEVTIEASLAKINGFLTPTKIVRRAGDSYRQIFYLFDEKKTPPTLSEIQVSFGSGNASSRVYYRFQDCQLIK